MHKKERVSITVSLFLGTSAAHPPVEPPTGVPLSAFSRWSAYITDHLFGFSNEEIFPFEFTENSIRI